MYCFTRKNKVYPYNPNFNNKINNDYYEGIEEEEILLANIIYDAHGIIIKK